MFPPPLLAAASQFLSRCRSAGLTVATAESCTGGLISGLLTEIAGSSDVIICGFVTYSNEAKTQMLAVPAETIRLHGAVSEPVARAMAEGAMKNAGADIAVAVTGVAGPGGGSADKPVGLVHISVSRKGSPQLHQRYVFANLDRSGVRLKTVAVALELMADMIGEPG